MTTDISDKWIRSAFWCGSLKPGAAKRFQEEISEALIPKIRRLPGVCGARALWPQAMEDLPPDIVCQVLVEFNSRADMERMLASQERQSMRESVKELAQLLDGSISHIDFRVA